MSAAATGPVLGGGPVTGRPRTRAERTAKDELRTAEAEVRALEGEYGRLCAGRLTGDPKAQHLDEVERELDAALRVLRRARAAAEHLQVG